MSAPQTGSHLPKTPRWVKVSALAALLLAIVFVVLHLTGNTPSHGGH